MSSTQMLNPSSLLTSQGSRLTALKWVGSDRFAASHTTIVWLYKCKATQWSHMTGACCASRWYYIYRVLAITTPYERSYSSLLAQVTSVVSLSTRSYARPVLCCYHLAVATAQLSKFYLSYECNTQAVQQLEDVCSQESTSKTNTL